MDTGLQAFKMVIVDQEREVQSSQA